MYELALDALESDGVIERTTAATHAAFATLIESGDWDLIVAATQTGSASDEHPYDGPLADWICEGGRAIVSDYRLDSDGAADVLACSGTSFTGFTNYTAINSDSDLFAGTIELTNPGWGYFTVGLSDAGSSRFAHTTVTESTSTGLAENAFGHLPEHTGIDETLQEWMLNDDRGVYHPSWAVSIRWSEPGGYYRQRLGDDAGINLSGHAALGFRIMQRHDDPLNTGSGIDFSLRLTDADGVSASVPLSASPQGSLRPNPAVGAGTRPKSVYEGFRIPLDLFTEDNPSIDLTSVHFADWVFDITPMGAIALDDIVFASAGLCE